MVHLAWLVDWLAGNISDTFIDWLIDWSIDWVHSLFLPPLFFHFPCLGNMFPVIRGGRGIHCDRCHVKITPDQSPHHSPSRGRKLPDYRHDGPTSLPRLNFQAPRERSRSLLTENRSSLRSALQFISMEFVGAALWYFRGSLDRLQRNGSLARSLPLLLRPLRRVVSLWFKVL